MHNQNIECYNMEASFSNPNDYWYYNQRYDMKEPGNMKGSFYSLVGSLLIIILSFLLSGCKSIQYVPVETIKTEFIHNTDTVVVRDTVQNEKETTIREATKADSAMLAKLGLQLDKSQRIILLLQKELAQKSHTEIEHKSDTVEVEKEVKVPYPVEKQLTKWQQFKLDFADIGFGVCALVILLACGYLFVRKRT